MSLCRVCDSPDLVPAIDLGRQPWANGFLRPDEAGREPFYPLRVVYCQKCQCAQLDFTVPKETMFGDHTYLSGVTRTLDEHFGKIAKEVDERFFAGKPAGSKAILDIGSNDGTQLKHYQAMGWRVQGVECSKTIAAMANKAGVPTLEAYFNVETARQLPGQFDVINASGVFFHLEELHSVTEAIREKLKPNGVFVVQFLYMKSIQDNLAFDQIYHEHLLYYTLRTIGKLLARHQLEMFDAYLSPIHGGSIIGYVGHPGARPVSERLQKMLGAEDESGCNTLEAYQRFSKAIEKLKADNLAYLRAAKAKGMRIYGLGAPVKGNTLLNYFGIGPDLISLLVERNVLRKGLVSPGMHIPVVMEDEVQPPDLYYVLAWNFKKEILQRNQALIQKGVQFYFPINPKETV